MFIFDKMAYTLLDGDNATTGSEIQFNVDRYSHNCLRNLSAEQNISEWSESNIPTPNFVHRLLEWATLEIRYFRLFCDSVDFFPSDLNFWILHCELGTFHR